MKISATVQNATLLIEDEDGKVVADVQLANYQIKIDVDAVANMGMALVDALFGPETGPDNAEPDADDTPPTSTSPHH